MSPDELSAMEDIKRLKARYCRLLDTKDWDGFASLFTENASLKADGEASKHDRKSQLITEWHGSAEIRRNIEQLTDASTVHHCHTPEITLTSTTTARAIWAMEDVIKWTGNHFRGYGHYNETYILQGGNWKIDSLHLTRIHFEILEGGTTPPSRRTGNYEVP